jgi:hypothetical protein
MNKYLEDERNLLSGTSGYCLYYSDPDYSFESCLKEKHLGSIGNAMMRDILYGIAAGLDKEVLALMSVAERFLQTTLEVKESESHFDKCIAHIGLAFCLWLTGRDWKAHALEAVSYNFLEDARGTDKASRTEVGWAAWMYRLAGKQKLLRHYMGARGWFVGKSGEHNLALKAALAEDAQPSQELCEKYFKTTFTGGHARRAMGRLWTAYFMDKPGAPDWSEIRGHVERLLGE